jgi:cytidylate kinase
MSRAAMTTQYPPHVERLVASQVRRWELERQKRARGDDTPKEPPPIITISRAYGARGSAVGKMVAEELGLTFWDRELLHTIAEQTGLAETLLTSLDEHAQSLMDGIIASVRGEDDGAVEYAQQLTRVVGTIGHHGSALIVGRGAQYIVEAGRAMRVRIHGSLETRAADYAFREGVDTHAAANIVNNVDKDRRVFCRLHFDRDPEELGHYDLVVNRDVFSVEQTAMIIATAYRSKLAATA